MNEGYSEHVQSLEHNFGFECENWSDYETALGTYDLEDIYEQYQTNPFLYFAKCAQSAIT